MEILSIHVLPNLYGFHFSVNTKDDVLNNVYFDFQNIFFCVSYMVQNNMKVSK